METIKKPRRGVLHTPLGSLSKGYRSFVGMLTIICVDTYALIVAVTQSLGIIDFKVFSNVYIWLSEVIICNTGLYSELINLYKLGSALSELNNKNII